jgi:Tfp pilus assembly protein PilF
MKHIRSTVLSKTLEPMRVRVLVVALATSALACGGGGGTDKAAKFPEGGEGGPSAATTAPVQAGPAAIVGQPGERADVSADAKEAYARGYQAFATGDLQTAKRAFKEAASKDSKSPAPEYALGVILERLGDSAGAQQSFRAAFNARSDFEWAYGAYALSLASKGALSEADAFLNDKKTKFPSSPRIATYLAEVKSLAGNHGEAQQLAQDALRMNPDFKDAMVTIARDHYRARKIELARYALQAILDGFGEASPARDKDNAEASLLRALVERELGHRTVAFAALEVATRLRPDLVEALIQLGAMRLEAGNAGDAQGLLENAAKFAPQNGLAHLNLGDCYRLLGRPADARRELEQALSLDSSLFLVHYNLGLLFLFSPSIPGLSAGDQVQASISAFERFKTARSKGIGDDVEDLLSRAKAKQAELKGGVAGAAPAGTATPNGSASTSAAPAPKAGAAKTK